MRVLLEGRAGRPADQHHALGTVLVQLERLDAFCGAGQECCIRRVDRELFLVVPFELLQLDENDAALGADAR